MTYLGSWKIGDYVGIPAATHRFSTGAAYAPTVLTYSIYEDGGTTGLDENVDMVVASPFDAIVGCYYVRRQLTAAAGFEKGKNYLVVVKATTDSVATVQMHTFQIEAEVDANTSSDLTAASTWAYGTRTLTTEPTSATTISARTASPPLRVGDVGATLRLTFLDQDGTAINLSAASTLQLKLRKPSGTAKVVTATKAGDGTDGVVQYLTVAGDIDEAGVWRIQGYAVTSAWTGHTSVSTFDVEDNL